MENEILKIQGEHLAQVLDAVDGEGNRFEFGTLYYYVVYLEKDGKTFAEVKSIQPKYTCLSLRKISNNSPAMYVCDNNKVETSRLFRDPVKAVELARFNMAKNRETTLEQIQSKIAETLEQFSRQIKHYDAMNELLTNKLKELC